MAEHARTNFGPGGLCCHVRQKSLNLWSSAAASRYRPLLLGREGLFAY
jgi:hypothetical protein